MNKKGISLISLIMYIVAVTILITIIAVFNANIVNQSEKFVYSNRAYEQYCKFNMFFIETLKNASSITLLNSVSIELRNSSDLIGTYTYDANNDVINYTYGTKTIDVCKNVKRLLYTNYGTSVLVEMAFNVDGVSYTPMDVEYTIGSGNR